MDAVESGVSHGIEVFFIGVPSSLKAGQGAVWPVELASLESDHTCLTPRQRKTPDQQSPENEPGLSATEENQEDETRPMFKHR